ncbi:MAG: PAS domain S-box protein, partial [Planctomycetota bacterium]|nr:PAS domain S-box protein [Planctomycetota bacterium]
TQRRKAEERVLREKRFSENLIDSSVDGILAYDDKCRCTIWNPGMEHISGVSKEEALGKCVFDVFPFLKKVEENKFFYEALAGRTVVAMDRPYIIPETGRQGFFEGYYSPLCDAAGKIIGGLTIMRDITARKRAEEEVRKSKALYQNLVETSHDLIFQRNNKGEFVFLNKAWESTTGYSIKEMLGKPFSNFRKTDVVARDSQAFAKLLEGEPLVGYETTYITKSGEERYLLFDVVPRYDISGRVIGTQGTAFDFTERKLAEQALESLNEELETTVERLIAANRELADFAHITAHDLRTPLRGIGSLAGIVSAEYGDKLDEQGRELLDMLVGRASRMYEQIGGILEYSEIGHVEEKKRRVDLNKLIRTMTAAITPPENIEVSVMGKLPTLMCNETRIEQVFHNLLDNAVKHIDKPEGRIEIDCVEEYGFWKFSIADNGRGIEEKYFTKIFEIFQTLVRRDEVEATGIGLSIAKKIIEISGGTIWVESEVGEGTTFFFTLPKQEMGAENEKLQTDTVG